MADALATADEGMPGGERTHEFDYAEVLDDTPELRDRPTRRPGPGTEVSYALAEILNVATTEDVDS